MRLNSTDLLRLDKNQCVEGSLGINEWVLQSTHGPLREDTYAPLSCHLFICLCLINQEAFSHSKQESKFETHFSPN